MKTRAALFSVLGLALVGACGDDAATPDAATPMPDMMAGPVCGNMMVETGEDCDDGNKDDGDGCDATCQDEINFFTDEGGEVRFEYLKLADADINGDNVPDSRTMTRVISFFRSDDQTDFHDYPVNFTTPGECFDVTDDTKWPTSQPMNAKYEDIGNLIISNSGSGSTQALNVPKATVAKDPLQRAHGVGNWYYHAANASTPGAAINDTSRYVSEKTMYDVTLTGSATWPATVYENAIYIPADFQLKDADGQVNPNKVNENVQLVAGQALTIKWDVVPSNEPAGTTNQWSLVGFIDGTNGAVVVCVNINNTGEQIVPAAMVDVIRAKAPAGTIVRQIFHHNVRELTNGTTVKGRRLDMIGVWCFARGYTSA